MVDQSLARIEVLRSSLTMLVGLAVVTWSAWGGSGTAHARPHPSLLEEETTEAEVDALVPQAPQAEITRMAQFVEPAFSESEYQGVLQRYELIDPGEEVPKGLLKKALAYYDTNRQYIKNPRFLTVVNFSSSSRLSRLHIIEMSTGNVRSFHVAHGKGSDPDDTGNATLFGNTSGSLMSSLGFYSTAETYDGKHGLSLRLDGLSSTNSNARSRAIVLHGADYVYDRNVKAGRSWGCLAVSMDNRTAIVNSLKGGSIIYAGMAR